MGKLMVFGILSLGVSEKLAAEIWGGGNQGNNNMIIEQLWSSEILILLQYFDPVDWNIVQIYIQNSKHETKSKPIFCLYDLEFK